MPSFARVWRTGSGDCSTSRMISSFSPAAYLMRRLPQPRSCFFQQPVLEHQLGNDLFQRAGLPTQILDLVRGRGPRGVAGQAFFASFQKFLRPAVIEVLDDPFAPAQLGDAVLAAQTGQNNADLLLRRKLAPGEARDLLYNLLSRFLHRPGFLSHLRSFNGYDGPEILPSSTRPFCLISADAGQPAQRPLCAWARQTTYFTSAKPVEPTGNRDRTDA